ncbi:MAG: serine/threonine protein kinase [Oscillospiraceae bacterium]
MLQTGQVINGIYEIISVIDKGGMSIVYLAMNRRANKQWAIKEVRKTGDKKLDVVRQNLIVEIDMLKKLNHPNLPSIIDVIDKDDTFLIVMDYIQGNSLQKLLKNEGAQPQEKVVKWGIQICDVLQYLHSQNPPIIYRDMKPANVMLKPDGNITVIDFGTAREFKVDSTEDTTCLGTKGYAAPEQYRGSKHHQTDERTDIYNLGVTLYHLLTNKHPNEPPYVLKPITEWNSNLSTGLEKIIIKCTKEDPDERYQSCAELMYDLQHYRDSDIKNLKISRRKLAAFSASILMSLVCAFTSINFNHKYDNSIIADYNSQIEKIYSASSYEEKLLYCLSAISIDSSNISAYDELINIFITRKSDGSEQEPVFSEYEDSILNSLIIGGTDAIVDELIKETDVKYEGTKFSSPAVDALKNNQADYAEFCYKTGTAYWFYYEVESARKSTAVAWFTKVKSLVPEDDELYIKSSIYESIGSFYSNIYDLNYRGEDTGEYVKYWNLLETLSESELDVSLRVKVYEEILNNISIYCANLKVDGVTYNQIADMIKKISEQLETAEISQVFKSEEIKKSIPDAIVKINTVYYKSDSSELISEDGGEQ